MGDQFVVVTTKQGQLRGQQKQSLFFQDSYYAFLGIPYAKPPLGELRFKAPESFGPWDGVRDALEDGPDPKQPAMTPIKGSSPIQGDEDCLYLNVFVKERPDKVKTKKPVLFSIHGGAFMGLNGNSKTTGPDFLLEEDIVFVSFNYRCGAFGFLSLEDASAPGNAGLKDQTFALRWVRDNIHSFGGDPENVTIMGCSAGGASVHYQLLSPTARGLFNKAIIMSGYAMNPWALQKHPKKIATALAKALGCSSEDPNEILKFLQSVSADDIVTTATKLTTGQSVKNSLGLIFVPCVEVAGDSPFLTDSPYHLMRRGEFTKVPVIMGNAVNEGSVMSMYACHACDAMMYLYYMTDPGFPTVEITAADKEAIRKHVKAWANFVSNGDPNSKQLSETWVRDSESEPRFMDIGISWTMKDGKRLSERMDFWKGLTSKYCST